MEPGLPSEEQASDQMEPGLPSGMQDSDRLPCLQSEEHEIMELINAVESMEPCPPFEGHAGGVDGDRGLSNVTREEHTLEESGNVGFISSLTRGGGRRSTNTLGSVRRHPGNSMAGGGRRSTNTANSVRSHPESSVTREGNRPSFTEGKRILRSKYNIREFLHDVHVECIPSFAGTSRESKQCKHRFLDKWGDVYVCKFCRFKLNDTPEVSKMFQSRLAYEQRMEANTPLDDLRGQTVGEIAVQRGVNLEFLLKFTIKYDLWDRNASDVIRYIVSNLN